MRILRFDDASDGGLALEVDGLAVSLEPALATTGLVSGDTVGLTRGGVEQLIADADLWALTRALNERLRDAPTTVDALREAGHARPVGDLTLLAPVQRPEKVVGIALNFASHADEAEREMPTYPTLFMKPLSTVSAPSGPIPIPRVTHRVDYEGELVVVIGRGGRYIAEETALHHVAGYAIGNDVSARDYQFRTTQMMQGKGFDGFLPLGPWLTSVDEVPDLGALELRTYVNDEQRQRARLDEMVFSVAHLVSYISDIMTLAPGDLILTGTPSGIGATLKPRRWLRAGDRVRVEITQLGSIESVVEPEVESASPDAERFLEAST